MQYTVTAVANTISFAALWDTLYTLSINSFSCCKHVRSLCTHVQPCVSQLHRTLRFFCSTKKKLLTHSQFFKSVHITLDTSSDCSHYIWWQGTVEYPLSSRTARSVHISLLLTVKLWRPFCWAYFALLEHNISSASSLKNNSNRLTGENSSFKNSGFLTFQSKIVGCGRSHLDQLRDMPPVAAVDDFAHFNGGTGTLSSYDW